MFPGMEILAAGQLLGDNPFVSHTYLDPLQGSSVGQSACFIYHRRRAPRNNRIGTFGRGLTAGGHPSGAVVALAIMREQTDGHWACTKSIVLCAPAPLFRQKARLRNMASRYRCRRRVSR